MALLTKEQSEKFEILVKSGKMKKKIVDVVKDYPKELGISSGFFLVSLNCFSIASRTGKGL